MSKECRCLGFELLELRIKELESEKLVMEEELIEQMMVNKALEFEKQEAENEAEDWKIKFEKLVAEIGASRDGEYELDENVRFPLAKKTESCKQVLTSEDLVYPQSSGSPNIANIATPVKDCILEISRGNVLSSGRRVNKMLSFEDHGSKQAGVGDLCGSDTEETSTGEKYEDEDVEVSEVNANTSTLLPGRKRKLVITSDSEKDDEDDIPISFLKKLKAPTQEMPDVVNTSSTGQRRVSARLRKQRVAEERSNSSEQNSKERLVGIPTTGKVEDDETEEESERESESESLDGFIVDDDSDESDKSVSENSDETRVEESDGEIGYADVISRLRRGNNPEKKQEWKLEADMLADFGKDPELCMRAVCTLYRFQTEGEKISRSSHVSNGRGFSMVDAIRGSRIAQFLTDGDPEGDLKKSVEELKEFEYEAVEDCRELAAKYSRQLFEIYKNREDPFFAPSPSA